MHKVLFFLDWYKNKPCLLPGATNHNRKEMFILALGNAPVQIAPRVKV